MDYSLNLFELHNSLEYIQEQINKKSKLSPFKDIEVTYKKQNIEDALNTIYTRFSNTSVAKKQWIINLNNIEVVYEDGTPNWIIYSNSDYLFLTAIVEQHHINLLLGLVPDSDSPRP